MIFTRCLRRCARPVPLFWPAILLGPTSRGSMRIVFQRRSLDWYWSIRSHRRSGPIRHRDRHSARPPAVAVNAVPDRAYGTNAGVAAICLKPSIVSFTDGRKGVKRIPFPLVGYEGILIVAVTRGLMTPDMRTPYRSRWLALVVGTLLVALRRASHFVLRTRPSPHVH